MNTNTVEQSIRLKELGIEQDEFYSFVWIDYDGRKQVAEWLQTVVGYDFTQHELRLINSDEIINYNDDLFLALTLDELHRVFDVVKFWCEPNDYKEKKWQLCNRAENNNNWGAFNKTANHAKDWTSILIWLLENNHVSVEQVNGILSEG